MTDQLVEVDTLVEMGPHTLEHYVLDHVLPRGMTQLNMPVLHAAGVATERGGLLLAGDSGAGKSTLSLWLAMNGWTFYGDDGIRVDLAGGTPLMWPAFANARIHATARDLFFAGLSDEGPVADYGPKRRLGVPTDAMAEGPTSVTVFVAIDTESSPPTPTLTPLRGSETMRLWAEQTFHSAADDPLVGVERLDQAIQFVRHLRGYRLAYERTEEAMPEVAALLRTALANRSLPAPPRKSGPANSVA